ncbi:MAG: alpha/beta hydrolase [Firmicutes bacterium]|nr:alpha/beta hydrolase [Bacillota bacterium]
MLITAHGASVYCERHGEGRNVLLLHGWGCSTELWRPVTERLSKRAQVTAIDFAGHGKSGRPPEPWGAEDYMEMTAEVIRTLGIEGCDIIGHSHGGRVALLLAATYPEIVGKLALTGAAGLHAEPTDAQKRRSAMYKRLRGVSETLDSLKIFGPLPERMREALRKRYGSRDYNALDAEMRKTFVKVVNFDVEPYLPKVQAPTLLLWGGEDTETPLWMGRRMEEMIPDAGLVVLAGGTHYAYLEKLPEFLQIVEHFLARRESEKFAP